MPLREIFKATEPSSVEAAQRRLALSQAMQQRSMQPNVPVQTGSVASQYGPGNALVDLANALTSAYNVKRSEKAYDRAKTSQSEKLSEAMQRFASSTPDEQVGAKSLEAIRASGDQLMQPVESRSEARTGLASAMGPDAQQAIAAAMLMPGKSDAPGSVKEYEYARQNGFKGSFQDWVVAGGQSSRPSSVQEWDFFSKLPQPMQARYLEMKRNPNVFVKDVNTVPTVIRPGSAGGDTSATPLSTEAAEAAAAAEKKRAEAAGGKLGEAQGGLAGGIVTKGGNAVGTKSALDIAEPLIDVATGSAAGAARDSVNAFFGKTTPASEAIAQLKVLQANLMTSMPRMEGPQSDRDVELYREAAGQIGDPKVPSGTKKAALKTIRQIQNKYIERAGGDTSDAPQRVTKSVGGKNYVQIDGQWYEDDGT